MEVGAAAAIVGCKPKMVFPEDFVMPRLFFEALADKYETVYKSKGIEFYNKVSENHTRERENLCVCVRFLIE